MQAGIIGKVDGGFSSLESSSNIGEENDSDLRYSFQITRNFHLEDGTPVYEGEAALEVVEEQESVEIDSKTGDISVTSSNVTRGKYSQFFVIPDTIMLVGSSDGTFAFDLLQTIKPGVSVSRAQIDLNEYASKYYSSTEVEPWQVGFYGNIGQAEKGVVYGENVVSDDEVGDTLDRSQINQFGMILPVDEKELKITVTESGYIEVYQPSNYGTKQFAEYLIDDLTQHIE